MRKYRIGFSAASLPRLLPLRTLFSRRWWGTTLLVLAALAVMVRLGFWQLDRLEQRQTRNAEITRQLALPPLPLTDDALLPEDLTTLKTRQAVAQGEFDFSHQVALKLQNWQGSPGIHLVTPLLIEGSSKAVLVDRGWIPQAEALPDHWQQFDDPGPVTVTGLIQLTQALPQNRAASKPLTEVANQPQIEWYRVDIAVIQPQMPYQLLPIYIRQSPQSANHTTLPYRSEPEFDLSDGPHLGYAIQWYIFALILGIGYIRYVGKETAGNQLTKKRKIQTST